MKSKTSVTQLKFQNARLAWDLLNSTLKSSSLCIKGNTCISGCKCFFILIKTIKSDFYKNLEEGRNTHIHIPLLALRSAQFVNHIKI